MKNILMNTEMTKAILDGCKVQTRRVIPFKLMQNADTCKSDSNYVYVEDNNGDSHHVSKYAKYQIGETIWVREPASIYYCNRDYMKIRASYISDKETIQLDIPSRFCKQTKDGWLPNWMRRKQGIPNGCIKEMARIFLKITDVRVERLQDISMEDIRKEGLELSFISSRYVMNEVLFKKWIELWNKTAPKGYKWEDNPYCFVYDFEVVKNES